ncbi:amino acid ABC transporter permease [Clostridium saccharobutylicum]|uniref:Putative glutamine ABC transporter permease protein GlnP n=1 Tax=Clostridium saccharobutylicum TaxID=169679 RepID=A0A1S8N3K8_CLOSA|nr:amino acid ABC transporter permease [Clostridium saccharobutylicum]OOM10993.1 putative glutamine ABC transporter permease protein GlnP [Clostridium saccharobutylicum]
MSEVFNQANMLFLLKGIKLTLTIAFISIALSMIFGTVLAILRNFSKGIFGKIATVYIEVFRNTPLLLWILSIRFLVPIPPMYSGILSFTLFTSAVMAEILRGGMNSVNKGQYEAAYSQGFSKIQTLRYIVLPQSFRRCVPTFLSQAVTVIKDTSFLWAVGIEEFTGKGMILMGSFVSSYQVFILFGFLAATYFIINFVISCSVRTIKTSY